MSSRETLCLMALTRVPRMSLANVRSLVEAMGSATAVYEHRHELGDVLTSARKPALDALAAMDIHMARAEQELEWAAHNGIQCLGIDDDNYPQRMRECADAPVILYYKGQANLNARHVVAVVGTRHITEYGKDLCSGLMRDLHALCPDALVVSGLAYGVDIWAHRECLANETPTVGVLAHGLDDLYPRAHRETANRMVAEGGALLTEFMTHTTADKINFVRRNRIVAGMSDAVVLVESADKGGGLITCGIARDYARDVFAFPGAVGAPYSEGCNHLIRDNGAGLITCADELVEAMGWQTDQKLTEAKRKGIERQLFPDLSPEEQRVVDELRKCNDLQINDLCVRLSVGVGPLTALLFSLEMKGVVRAYAGGSYHLVAD